MGLDLVRRVSRAVCALLVPASIAGGLLGGWRGSIGVLAGALVSLTSLHWIARSVKSAAGFFARGLRYVLLFGAVGLLLTSGVVHPLALMGGLSILPPVLIVAGLQAARSLP